MKQKFIAHKGLILFSNLFPLALVLFELTFIILSPFKIGSGWFAFIIQFSVIWLILFIIFHNSYRTIVVDLDGIKTGKILIKWENISKYKIRKTETLKSIWHPSLKFKPMLYIYDEAGRKIRFALDDKRIKNMLLCSQGKSIVVHKIQKDFDKTSKTRDGKTRDKTGDGGLS